MPCDTSNKPGAALAVFARLFAVWLRSVRHCCPGLLLSLTADGLILHISNQGSGALSGPQVVDVMQDSRGKMDRLMQILRYAHCGTSYDVQQT